MKTNTTLQKKLNKLSEQFSCVFREATHTDFRAWAYSDQLDRKVYGDWIFELVIRPKDPAWKDIQRVYLLERSGGSSAQVVGVCEEPSQVLLLEIKS